MVKPSWADVEPPEIPRRVKPAGVDCHHRREGRTTTTPGKQGLQGFRCPLGDTLETRVRQPARPAPDPQAQGLVPHCRSGPGTSDLTVDADPFVDAANALAERPGR